ncbi:MAG: hypothetical protein SWK90_05345 [Chloroflexota bacterium]|nr:hypothetical protein [Chloroflexota bacterium]
MQAKFRGTVGQRLLTGDQGEIDVVIKVVGSRSAGYNWRVGCSSRTGGLYQRGYASQEPLD